MADRSRKWRVFGLCVSGITAGWLLCLFAILLPGRAREFEIELAGEPLPDLTESVLGAARFVEAKCAWILLGLVGILVASWRLQQRRPKFARILRLACSPFLLVPLAGLLSALAAVALWLPTVKMIDTLGGGPASPVSASACHAESYDPIIENTFRDPQTYPLSTIAADVDTASYANVRRFLQQGQLPPEDAVRVEEMINYFVYDYPPPSAKDAPLAVHLDLATCPWPADNQLLRIGLQGRELDKSQSQPKNLVFLLDVSGSMGSPKKLPLLKTAMKMLVEQLAPADHVAVVVYAGSSGIVLPPTPCTRKAEIVTSLDRLEASGSTNGGAGILAAYQLANEAYIADGVNRVILCTDGDFNVGITDRDALIRRVQKQAQRGVFLSVLGFGMGNLKDGSLEQLADNGNGNYGYIDTPHEARKLLVEQIDASLVTLAKDVKLQVAFAPGRVSAYRLIGYENRLLSATHFDDDSKDAGEIGSGHRMTVLYEIVPTASTSGQAVTVSLRYKAPDGDESLLLETAFADTPLAFQNASADFRFAAMVAAFGMQLRGSPHLGELSLREIAAFAEAAQGEDRFSYRPQFLELVGLARQLSDP
jgi:Ca-activated chloride channel homolog